MVKLSYSTLEEIGNKYHEEPLKVVLGPFPDGRSAAVPMKDPYVPVIILSPDHKAEMISLETKEPKFSKDFGDKEFQQEMLKQFQSLRQQWDTIAKSPAYPLLDNFQEARYVLVLEQGHADINKLHNTINPAKELPETDSDPKFKGVKVTGETAIAVHPEKPNELLHVLSLSTNRFETTLLHELSHAADRGLSDSKLFNRCLTLDRFRGFSMLEDLVDKMDTFIANEQYTPKQKNQELFARLNQKRQENPEQFKKECPLLDAFYSNVVYPALHAQTIVRTRFGTLGNTEILDTLNDPALLDLGAPLTQEQQNECNKRRKQIRDGSDIQKREALQREQSEYMSTLPGFQKLMTAMSDFKGQMETKAGELLEPHITRVSPPNSDQKSSLLMDSLQQHSRKTQESPSQDISKKKDLTQPLLNKKSNDSR